MATTIRRRKKPARAAPRYRRTRTDTARVIDMLAIGLSQPDIAERLGMSVPTVAKLYGPEFEAAGVHSGVPTHKPTADTRKTARFCAAIGLDKAAIAKILRIKVDTLNEMYTEEIQGGRAEGQMKVAGTLFKKATDPRDTKGGVVSAIFWLKAQGGWRETDKLEVSGPDGGPIETTAVVILPSNGRDDEDINGQGGN
jgi:hypothetical protein